MIVVYIIISGKNADKHRSEVFLFQVIACKSFWERKGVLIREVPSLSRVSLERGVPLYLKNTNNETKHNEKQQTNKKNNNTPPQFQLFPRPLHTLLRYGIVIETKQTNQNEDNRWHRHQELKG